MKLDVSSEELVAIRRHLHSQPELSFTEHKTAEFIESNLQELGFTTTRCADTGVIAILEGQHDGPTLLFRADIDALPIHELNHVDYRSEEPGIMHACGHDVHTTIGLGIAKVLSTQTKHLHGRIKFVFQPAEEASPVDAPIGAERMVAEGALENPAVDAAFAFHVMPTLDVGKIGYTGGPVWARSELVEIEITGKKAHAAYPHEGVDAVLIAAQVITALQTVTSRRVDARHACVLTIGKIEAGNSYNIIADTARLTGILRTLSDETAELAMKEVERVVQGISQGLAGEGKVTFTAGARLTANNTKLERRVVDHLKARLGDERIVAHEPQMGAEDFASFSRRVPSCYLFLGVRNEAKGIVHMLHTPYFDVDEDCLKVAVDGMASALLDIARTWRTL